MEIKFLIMCGETKTSLRTRLPCGKEKLCDPVAVTGRSAPFPTTIDEGVSEEGDEKEECTSIRSHVRASARVGIPFGRWWLGERHRVEGLHQRVPVPCTTISGVPGH
jgi:hypothetical protein